MLALLLVLIMISAHFFSWFFNKLHIPSVLGELCAGIVLGPSLLGFITPSPLFNLLAEIGVVLLLFEVGLHTDLSRLLNTGKKPVIVAFMGFILPIILGFLVACYFQLSYLVALFIGGALSATSIGISVRVLSDLKQQHSHEAHVVLGAAIIDDLFGVLLLALLYNFASKGIVNFSSLGVLTLGTLILVFLAPLLVKISFWFITYFCPKVIFPTLLLMMSLTLIALLSFIAHQIGAPSIIGGFAAGIALSPQFGLQFKNIKNLKLLHFANQILRADNIYFENLHRSIKPINYCFIPIFFVMVGASINLHQIQGSAHFWILSLSLVAIAFISKFASGFFIQEPRKLQRIIGAAMIPRGEVGLIFASLGLKIGILNDETYACLVVVIALTTLVPPFLLNFLYSLEKKST